MRAESKCQEWRAETEAWDTEGTVEPARLLGTACLRPSFIYQEINLFLMSVTAILSFWDKQPNVTSRYHTWVFMFSSPLILQLPFRQLFLHPPFDSRAPVSSPVSPHPLPSHPRSKNPEQTAVLRTDPVSSLPCVLARARETILHLTPILPSAATSSQKSFLIPQIWVRLHHKHSSHSNITDHLSTRSVNFSGFPFLCFHYVLTMC